MRQTARDDAHADSVLLGGIEYVWLVPQHDRRHAQVGLLLRKHSGAGRRQHDSGASGRFHCAHAARAIPI